MIQLKSVHLLDLPALVSGFQSNHLFHIVFSPNHQTFTLQEPDFRKVSVLKTEANQNVGRWIKMLFCPSCVSSQHVISFAVCLLCESKVNLLMNQQSSEMMKVCSHKVTHII